MLKTPQLNSFLHRGEILSDGVTDVDTLASSEGAIANSIWNLFEGDALLDLTQTDAAGVSNLTIDRSTGSAPGSTTPAIASSGNTGATLASLNVDTALAVTVANGATVEIDGASAQSVTFAGTTGTLKIDDSLAFAGQVSGLTGSDALDLADVSYGANTTASFSGDANGGTLTVTDGTDTAHIALVGDYLTSGWTLSSDGNGGTVVVDPPAATPGDGSANGPGGTPQFANILSGYTIRPSWLVAGVDYAVGVKSGTVLKDPATINMAGVTVDLGNHTVTVTGANVTLDGYNFSLAGGWGVVSQAANTTISNSYFKMGSNLNAMIIGAPDSNCSNLTVINCVLDGNNLPDNYNWASIDQQGPGLVLEYSLLENAYSDFIDMGASGSATLKYNVFYNNGNANGHPDVFQLSGGNSYTCTIEYNTTYETSIASRYPAASGTQGFMLTQNAPAPARLVGPQDISFNTSIALAGAELGPLTTIDGPNVTGTAAVHDNFADPTGGAFNQPALFGDPTGFTANSSYYNNYNMVTGGLFYQNVTTNPTTPTVPLVNPLVAPITNQPDSPRAPVITGHTVNNNIVTLTGTVSSTEVFTNCTVRVFDGSTQIGLADTNANGNWTFTTGALTAGTHSFTAIANDINGYVSPASTAFTQTISGTTGTAPTITSIVENPATGDFNVGHAVTLTLSFSGAVTVGGIPTLTLNDGGTATYASGSGTSALVFNYTTAAGQNTSSLAATAVNLPSGATIKDGSGNAATLLLTGLTQTGPQIDTTVPLVSTASAAAGDYNAGKTLTLTLNMSEAVTVTGTPTLTLNDGGTATYTGGTGTNALTFSYTVASGQNTAALAVTAVNGTLADLAGNSLSTAALPKTFTGVTIDTTVPGVSLVAETPPSGDLNAGKTVTLTLNLSEAVTVTGAPTLTLNDGGTATYTGGSGSTSALTFSYTVASGQNTAALAATAVNLNGATVQDGGGNIANLSLTGLTQTGPQIDTTIPSVTQVIASPGSGIEFPGNTVTLTLAMSKAVTVTGTPTLTLNDGGTATYVGGSGTVALTFSYTVGASDSTVTLAITQVNLLNGATVKDAAGNAANLSGALTTFPGLLIDPPGPSVSSVAETPSSGDLNAGNTVTLTLNMSAAVTVAGGTPTLTLNDGGTATYTGGSGSTSALTFSYTVANGQNTAALAATALNLNGATVKDGGGNTANFSLTGLPQTGPQIDTTVPAVSSVVASGTGITTGAGDLGAGSVVTLTLNLSEAVTVAGGTPTLTLNDGGTATYTGGAGSYSALTFSYTVAAGQNTADLAVTAFNPSGATITDGAGNVANLTGAVTTPAGTLQIDTTIPTVSSVATSGTGITAGTGDLGAGSVVTLTLNLSEAVTVAGGTPTLALSSGGTATYTGGAGSHSALTFSYTVGAGQNTSDLAVTAFNLGTATITDGAGNVANLTGAVTTPAGTLQIDTTTPTVSSVATSGTGITAGAGDLGAGSVVTLTLNMSEAVNVTGTPTLTLNDGGTATYTGGPGSHSALTFSYTVAAGQNTSDLAVTAFNPGTATITDGAGNAANLSGAVTNPAGTLQINTTGPTVSSVVTSGTGITAGTGDLAAGSVVTLTLNMSGAVTVAGGTPTLTLNDGGTATYTGGAGSQSALTFSYTVAAGQNTSDLAVTAFNPGTATITDGVGNAANFTGAVTNPAGTLQIDTTTPTVSSLATSGTGITAGTGDLGAGSVVTVTLNLSEAVTVAGGTPTLTLNDGGTATYTGGAGSHSALTFSYTVAAGQNTADLAVTAFNPGGATITDGAGNVANLTGAVTTPAGTLQIDTTIPTLSSVAETPPSGHLKAGKSVTLTLNMSEAVTVVGGTPTLTLNDGGTATYTGGAGSHSALTFSYTVAAGHNTASLAATTVNLNGATVKDGAGNAAILSLSGLTQAGAQIDTTIPAVTQVVASPATGIESPGMPITLTLDLSEAVTVTGTPTLTLNDGGTATYISGAGTNALTFSYTVGASDSTVSALAITQVNLPNGATVSDDAGNAADLSGALTTLIGLQIDPPAQSLSVTALNLSVAHGQGIAASSLFAAGVPTGDTITKYAFYDTGTGGGHFLVNGVAQGTNQEIDVTAAQLAQVTYQSGSGADTLYVRVNDGAQWSPWSNSFTVTAPVDTGPAVTATNTSVAHNANPAAASLFAVSDPFGDPMTAYQFWDNTSASTSGNFVVNGVAQGALQVINVTAAQLSQTSFQSGVGTDDLWVRASDNGTQWSAWTEFHVTAPVDTGPVVTATDQSVAHNANPAAASLFTATDPLGDPMTAYQFWDNTSAPTSGNFVVNGVAQGALQVINVSAAQLSQTSFQSGSGTDDLWVRASDNGTQWSAWTEFQVTAPADTGPVVTATDKSVAHNANPAAASLFTASDPFGDPMTAFQFWDNTGAPTSGNFVVNGVAQGALQVINVSAAQLSQTSFQSGSGTDDLWVRASDNGTQWSAWTEFHVTAPPDTGPVVTATNTSVAHNANPAAASLFAMSDPFGDPMTAYQFWDNTADPTSGNFVVNGVAQGALQVINVSAAQLGQTSFQSGSGTDDLWVRASDNGTQWSAWTEFHVTAPVDTGPTVTVSSRITVPGQTFAASSLITASDPLGDSMTAYQFWDNTSASTSGHFVVNAVSQGALQVINVSAAQLSQASFQSGSGPDDLWVRASDGTQWSAWTEFAVTGVNPATIAAGATLELASAYSGTASFAGATGTLRIDNSSSFSGKIAGQLAIGDVIDLADVTAGAAAKITYSASGGPGTLTVSDGTHTASIALLGNYSLASFTASSDGHGGTSVVDPPLTSGSVLYSAMDPAGSQGGLNQQIALLSQSMAAFAPTDGGGAPKDALVAFDPGQLSNLAQPSPNQQHA